MVRTCQDPRCDMDRPSPPKFRRVMGRFKPKKKPVGRHRRGA